MGADDDVFEDDLKMTGCGAVALPPNLRVERQECGKEVKWLVFHEDKRGAQGKLVAQLHECGAAGEPTRAEERQGFIKAVSVRPKLRGQNVALALLEMCKDFMRDHLGYCCVLLEAEEDMARFGKLVGLYERAGFEVVDMPNGSSFKMLYNGDETYRVVPMRCNLRAQGGFLVSQMQRLSLVHALAKREATRSSTRCTISIWDALSRSGGLARATSRMRAAESCGHPDWVQFLALVQHLGAFSRQGDWGQPVAAVEGADSLSDLWLAGMPATTAQAAQAGCEEASIKLMGEVEANSGDQTELQAPHLDGVQPVWSDDEYLYTVFEKNACVLPSAFLHMLRFRRLDKLLQAGVYDKILGPGDRSALSWVHLYAQLWRNALLPAALALNSDDPASEQDLLRAKMLARKFAPEPLAW
ncbi:Inositol oxygenase [Hondaea fermentalgiana]|uniref:inositol oxygenase n=1 Tax=Hondaea fermentalgiana TaxID=2315210 RepID=A0A2R5GV41_9STRA|nr:Inositol oxygenase [Hondaea fermentalgiana]|eukprot:GBG32523.1 Inositol oxygenase [Hondaea fermentalgiana]